MGAGPWAVPRLGVLALLWGSTFLWIKVALAELSPAQVTFARCALGAAALLAACRWAGHRLPRDRATWSRLVVAAFLCNALPFALFSVGQRTVDSGVAGVLNATTPFWALLLGIALGAERTPRPIRLTGLLLGFAGVTLIFAPWGRAGLVSVDSLAILGAAASYAVGFAWMGRELAGRGVPTIALSAAQLVAATGWSLLALPAGGLTAPRPTPATAIAVLVLGVLCTAVTFHLTFRVIAEEGATNAAAVGYLLPVVSVALGAVFLGESLTPRTVAGMVVVLAGVALTRRGAAPPPTPVAEAATRTPVATLRATEGTGPGRGR
ncbi:Permease of the drug/metabolite transporter (DMT) superfamily [Micromonospora citrea]|uniref:Permease of the drug/metabolite transporter (DMT) superfamily n=1 Tax=Micromonospora citrea TaxID=47855 RepID=A0A1C6U4Q4_9ACTN|nr:DMT family transporter [Micromonospora citrea]SCL49007.1 Permease of the drug/metabolite transporter (DMT) superfamily [Micromonospora citrea]